MEKTINKLFDRYTPSVAQLSVVYPRCIGMEGTQGSGYSTAFIVCAETGLLLTNRHVVTSAGLAHITAKFKLKLRQEKPRTRSTLRKRKVVEYASITLDLKVRYVDPIHDFAFLQISQDDYERLSRKFVLEELSFNTNFNDLKIGLNLFIIGNNKNKCLSIETGKVLEIDVTPPHGMDYNISMITADDKTRPGFSGAPVLNQNGEVIAIVSSNLKSSGSKLVKHEVSYHICVKQIENILKKLQGYEPVQRGTSHVVLEYDSDHNCVIKSQLPVPGFTAVKPGDRVKDVNGIEIDRFETFNEIIDANVGKVVKVRIIHEETVISIEIEVESLEKYAIVELFEISNALLHRVEYSTCLYFGLSPCSGLYISSLGYMFQSAGLPKCSVITHFNETPIHGVQDAALLIESFLKKGILCIWVTYKSMLESGIERKKIIKIDHKWFHICQRFLQRTKKNLFCWTAKYLKIESRELKYPSIHWTNRTTGKKFRGSIKEITRLLVIIKVAYPFQDGNCRSLNSICVGTIVDSQKGLIVCERFLVNTMLCDITVVIDGRHSVGAKVIFIHPFHLYSVVQINMSTVGEKIFSLAKLDPSHLSKNPVTVGSSVSYFGLSLKSSVIYNNTGIVTNRASAFIKDSDDIMTEFVARNFEFFQTSNRFHGLGGLFFDEKKKKIVGFNFHFLNSTTFCGIEAYSIAHVLQSFRYDVSTSEIVDVMSWIYPVHFDFIPFYECRENYKMPTYVEEEVHNAIDMFQRTLILVKRRLQTLGSESDETVALDGGDLIIKVNKKVTTNLFQLEDTLFQMKGKPIEVECLTLKGDQMVKQLSPRKLTLYKESSAVHFSGLVFKKAGVSIASNCPNFVTPEDILLFKVFSGSPGKKSLGRNELPLKLHNFDGEPVASLSKMMTFIESKRADDISKEIEMCCFGLNGFEKKPMLVLLDFELWPPFLTDA